MDAFVDAMDLMDAGEESRDGGSVLRPQESYNPTLHRAKEAILHSTPVADLKAHPKLKFFEPPSRVPKRGKQPLEACIKAFDIKQVPKRGAKVKDQGSTRKAAIPSPSSRRTRQARWYAQDSEWSIHRFKCIGGGSQRVTTLNRSWMDIHYKAVVPRTQYKPLFCSSTSLYYTRRTKLLLILDHDAELR
ncbi:hypothetical protein FA13DRAFT_1789778 [Coprinellus micaceus]|uniref:Uncharacterized protein n=1 Tax=Coprinellus micaceus TaxID=71717 RepID=A0A4Y7TIJ7_COPMI|nr:hypothetical protein FA13DRAFT_1789778 [Coprinellus micaceus]